MIRRYKNNLLSFVYPENWKLTDDEQEGFPREVSLESPEGTLWVVHAFTADTDPDELLKEAIATLQQNYQDFEYEKVAGQAELKPKHAIEANFFCLDFLVTARIQVFTGAPLTLMVVQQAESRQFEQALPVFDAVTTSLIHPETAAGIESSDGNIADRN